MSACRGCRLQFRALDEFLVRDDSISPTCSLAGDLRTVAECAAQSFPSGKRNADHFLLFITCGSIRVRMVNYCRADVLTAHGATNLSSCTVLCYCGFIRLWPLR